MPDINVNIPLIEQTAAAWAADATVYATKRILITNDVFFTGTDQKKFKLSNGVDTWANLDYIPIGSLTFAQVLAQGNITGGTKIIMSNGDNIEDPTGNIEMDFGQGFGYWAITTDNGVYSQPYIYIDTNSAYMADSTHGFFFGNFIAPGVTRFVHIRPGEAEIKHDVKIELDAPDILLEQEIASRIMATDANKKIDTPYSFDTDGTLAANSDTVIPSQKAVKTYADGLVAGLLDDRGSYDASVNTFPASGGSGTAGAILKGDIWYISVAGTLGGVAVTIGDSVRAIADAPGQTATNWSVLETNIGYVPENVANKSTTLSADQASNTKYPSVKSVYDWAVGLFQPINAVLTGLISLGATTFGTIAGTFTEGNDARLSDARNRKIQGYQNTDSSHTGSVTETILCNIALPANSMGANDVFRYQCQIEKTGVVGTATFFAYLSPTSNSLVGAIPVGQNALVATNLSNGFERRVVNKNSQSANEVHAAATNNPTDYLAQTFSHTTTNIDFSVNQWFIISTTLTITSETGTLNNVQTYVDKA